MAKRRLPQHTRDMILVYYSDVWLHHSEHPTEAKIWAELPSSLRARVATYLTKKLLGELPLFADVREDVRDQISARLMPVDVAPGELACNEVNLGV